jgi:hypothetical protein
MKPSLNLFASKFVCVTCREEHTVTGATSLECSNCGSTYRSNFKAALASGIGAAGFVMAVGTALLHVRPSVAGVIAAIAGLLLWRASFEVVLIKR